MLSILILLTVCIAFRAGVRAAHWKDLDQLWYDFEHRRLRFQIARAIDVVTYLSYLSLAFYSLWTLDTHALGFWVRTATIAAIGSGISLLGRFSVHKFPRMNNREGYANAQAALITNLVLTIVYTVAMTALTAFYYWWRG